MFRPYQIAAFGDARVSVDLQRIFLSAGKSNIAWIMDVDRCDHDGQETVLISFKRPDDILQDEIIVHAVKGRHVWRFFAGTFWTMYSHVDTKNPKRVVAWLV